MGRITKKDNPIALPLKDYADKIDEFQEYLKKTPVKNIVDSAERHDEMKVQILLMKELPSMLKEYKSLMIMEEEQKNKDGIRGDAELSPVESGLLD